jgi:hypothetical protein
VLVADCIAVEGKLPILDADGKPALMLNFVSSNKTRMQLQAQLVSLNSDGTVFAEFSRAPKEGALLMTDFTPMKPMEIKIGGLPYAIFTPSYTLIRADGSNGMSSGRGPFCVCCAPFTVTGTALNGVPLTR